VPASVRGSFQLDLTTPPTSYYYVAYQTLYSF
jgi:hypothetical protein